MTSDNPMTCAELVELVTEYLEDALSSADKARFEAHVQVCPDCGPHLAQMRRTISLLGRIPTGTLSADAERSLLEAFREWKRAC